MPPDQTYRKSPARRRADSPSGRDKRPPADDLDGHDGVAGKGRSPRKGAAGDAGKALRQAADHCNAALAYCTTKAPDVADLEDLLCLVDCAQLCSVTADFAARASEHSDELRGLCSELCKCVEERCRAYAGGDATMAACADACSAAFDVLSAQATPKVG